MSLTQFVFHGKNRPRMVFKYKNRKQNSMTTWSQIKVKLRQLSQIKQSCAVAISKSLLLLQGPGLRQLIASPHVPQAGKTARQSPSPLSPVLGHVGATPGHVRATQLSATGPVCQLSSQSVFKGGVMSSTWLGAAQGPCHCRDRWGSTVGWPGGRVTRLCISVDLKPAEHGRPSGTHRTRGSSRRHPQHQPQTREWALREKC